MALVMTSAFYPIYGHGQPLCGLILRNRLYGLSTVRHAGEAWEAGLSVPEACGTVSIRRGGVAQLVRAAES
jgi:hypothetical protein